MKRVFITGILMIFIFNCFAQDENKMKEEEVVNCIVYVDGQELVGYAKKKKTVSLDGVKYNTPWKFQSEIAFISKDVFDNSEKIKNKMFEKYTPKKCEGYRYADSLIYKSVKYGDAIEVSAMIPKQRFLRETLKDKITLYTFYTTPPPIQGANDNTNYYELCNKPKYAYKLEETGKVKSVLILKIIDELSDCPKLMDKYSENHRDEEINLEAIYYYLENCK